MARSRRTILSAMLVAATVVGATIATSPAIAGDYKLGPQDRVKIKAYDWRPGSDDTHEWTALTGEFIVSASGTLSLPIVGELKVANTGTPDVAKTLAREMQSRLGLANEPYVSIEISKFRPFYIVGAVQTPGEFAYRPGLTILQAIGIAGGPLRLNDMSMVSLERDAIVNRGEFRSLEAERLQLLMKQARLKAQVDGDAGITLPPEVSQRKMDKAVARLIAEETSLFDSKKQSQEAQLGILHQTQALLEQEVKSLALKDQSLDRQIELITKDRDAVSSLMARGLTSSLRQSGVEQNLAQFESMRLDVRLAQLKAKQGIALAQREAIELQNKSKSQALADASDARTRLAGIDERKKAAAALVYEAEVRAPSEINLPTGGSKMATTYSVTRENDGISSTSVVTENDRIEPGDTIKVERRPSLALSAGD